MMHGAAKVLQTFDIGKMRLRPDSGAQHQEARVCSPAVFRSHHPPAPRLIKFRGAYSRIEANVLAQVQFAVDIVEVLPDLVPGRVQFVEVPVLPQIFTRELIQRSMRIAACAWVAVPVPNAAQRGRGFVDFY